MNFEDEIHELRHAFRGLDCFSNQKPTNIMGVLSFHAHSEGLISIEDWFEIKIVIPSDYPDILLIVTETQGKIHSDYDHLNPDSTFCLASALAERRVFNQESTLLGFVNNLVVPFLYSYCYREKHGSYPFGDLSHGLVGVIEYYLDIFETDPKPELLEGLKRIVKFGYRGHHPCPCGSGRIVRKCHKNLVQEISRSDTRQILSSDMESIKAAIEQHSTQSISIK